MKEFMPANRSFNHFVNEVFGSHTLSLDESSDYRNNIIGAVENFYRTGEFSFFCSNLKQRLCRLRNKYYKKPDQIKLIIDKVRNLANPNWQGYYSELVAIDFFSYFTDLELEISVPSTLTYAHKDPKRRESSFDGRFNDDYLCNLFFEVKSFQDNNKTMLDNIKKKVIRDDPDVKHISCEYPLHLDYKLIEEEFPNIIYELKAAVAKKDHVYKPANIDYLVFRIYYEPQNLTITTHNYNSYCQANEWKYFVFNHLDQFFLESPNLLVFVLHPWFNLNNCVDFEDSNKIFFRSFARRVFCELTKNNDVIAKIPTVKWSKDQYFRNIKISELSRKISAILFIVDNNVEPKVLMDASNNHKVLEAYVYKNPNVDEENESAVFFEHLTRVMYENLHARDILREYEDFYFDNY